MNENVICIHIYQKHNTKFIAETIGIICHFPQSFFVVSASNGICGFFHFNTYQVVKSIIAIIAAFMYNQIDSNWFVIYSFESSFFPIHPSIVFYIDTIR